MIYVIYHKNCNDGTASAWTAWLKFGKNAKYIPHMYNEDPPIIPADCEYLYILDYSFPRIIMDKFYEQLNGNIQVIDHHKTAEENLKGFPKCIFDMTQCGAVLSWKFFHPDKKLPIFLEYIQDYDIWTKKLPYTDEVSAYINSFDRNIENFNTFKSTFETSFESVVKEGSAMLRYHEKDIQKICSSARKYLWKDETPIECIIVNTPAFMASDVGNVLCKKHTEAKFVCCYSDTHEGYRYYSLRSVGDFDVSKLAAKFPGGGGHKNASGFLVKNQVNLFFPGE